MALTEFNTEHPPWTIPRWPELLPEANTMRAVYGSAADELTIRFAGESRRDLVTMYIASPEIEYVGVIVRWDTGEVVGIQVDYFADYAVLLHPRWQIAIDQNQNPDQIRSIVKDVKHLYEKYGAELASARAE